MKVTNCLSKLKSQDFSNNIRASIIGYFSTVYVTVLNPLLLSKAGMPTEEVFIATCITMALSCYCIAYFVRLPILTGPTMALNTYFVTGLCGNMHMSWQEALGVVFISGILILMIANTNIKSYLLNTIPQELENSIKYGIGAFLGLIAIKCSAIYDIDHQAIDIQNIMLFALTMSIMFVIDYLKKSGSAIIALTITTVITCLINNNTPNQIVYLPDLNFSTFLAMKLPSTFDLNILAALFAVFIVVTFDSGISGNIITQEFVSEKEQIKEKSKGIFKSLGLSSIMAAMLGTSSTGVYLESFNIVQAKGSAGYVAAIIGSLFLATIIFKPLIFMIPAAATSAILFYIALSILKDWQFLKELNRIDLITSIVIMLVIPINSSIPDGIGYGIILHTLLNMAFTKNYKISTNRLILFAMFSLFFVIKIIY